MSEIIPQSYLTPGGFAQVNVAMGPGTAAIGARDIVLVSPKLSTGSYTANTVYEVERESDAATGAGLGSLLHRAVRRVLQGNRTTRLWVVPVAETSGGSPVAADSDITITATPTGSGAADLTVVGELFSYTFGTSDTPTTIAAGLAALVNGATHLPVVASNVAGVLTLTAKLKGVSQNSAHRWRTSVTAGVGVSFSAAAGVVGDATAGADGSTTEAANLATALAVLDADSGYHVGITACDATSIGHLVTHLAACAEPLVGLRKVGFVGVNGTKATAAALATARNYERLHIVWQDDSDHDPAELMAGVIAVYGLERNLDPSWAPVGYRKPAFTLRPAFAQSSWPTGAEISDAMSDGLVVIGSDKNGAFIVDGLTTRSKDATKTYDDRRALYSERISVGDALAERCVATYVQRYQGLKLDQDETLADGSVNANQTYNLRAVKPSQVKDMVGEILTQADKDLEIKNLEDSLEALSVEQSSVNTQRLVVRFPFEAIDYARQATFQLDEVSR